MKKTTTWLTAMIILAIGATVALDLISEETQKLTALLLLPLSIVTIVFNKVGLKELGVTKGTSQGYGLAVFYPLGALSAIILIDSLTVGLAHKEEGLERLLWVIPLESLLGILGAFLTEELFFRGVCWSLLKRLEFANLKIVVLSGFIFILWHVPIGLFEFGSFDKVYLPIYFINAFLLGLNWGLLRLISGSTLVSSVCHSLWNSLTYRLFGFGGENGFFLSSFYVFDPERGWLGIPLNLIFLAWFYRIAKQKALLI